ENDPAIRIYYNTGNHTLEELLNFPMDPSMFPRAPAPPQPAISDAPPPKVVPKHFTGRIPPESRAKGNRVWLCRFRHNENGRVGNVRGTRPYVRSTCAKRVGQ